MHFSNCFFRFPCAKVMCFSAVCPSLQLRFPGASGLLFSYSPTRSRSESFPFCSRNIEKSSLRFNIFSLCIYILFVYTFYFLKNLFFFCHLFSCTTLPNYAIVIAVRKHLYPILSLWVFPLPNPYRPERCFLTALRFLPKKHGESHAFFLSVFLPAA